MKLRHSNTGALVAGTVALLIVAISLAASIAVRTGVTDPRVRVVSSDRGAVEEKVSAQAQRYQAVQRVMTGEVATTARRVQEATLTAAASGSLLAMEMANGRMPANAESLVAALLVRKLLPFGFSKGQRSGTVVTDHGTLAVRYRSAPASVEVFSVGKGEGDGPAILVRIPDDGSESGIWLSESVDDVSALRPFAPAAELIAAGWQPDALPNVR